MSRFALVCSLVFGLSSATLAADAHAQFARPPSAGPAAGDIVASVDARPSAGAPALTEMRMPRRAAPDRAAVRAALMKARASNLASFRVYVRKGVFPSNTMSGNKLNVWRDDDGHICAAATIIKMSGQDELVASVAEQNNFIRLADVTQGPVMDWILTSGFTQDEIAMIQEPFMPVGKMPVAEPDEPALAAKPAIDTKLRAAEDARLRAKYKSIDKTLVKNARRSLDKAVDRLMQNNGLAWQLVDSQG